MLRRTHALTFTETNSFPSLFVYKIGVVFYYIVGLLPFCKILPKLRAQKPSFIHQMLRQRASQE